MKRPYYILNSGRLRRRQNTIYFEPYPHDEPDAGVDEEILAGFTNDNDEQDAQTPKKRKPIPVEDIEAFYVMGEMDFNTKFFNFLSQQKIPVHIFNYYGYYSGTFMPREYLPSGFTAVEQVKSYLDTRKRMYIAREIVDAASYNIVKNLQYYSKPARQSEEKSIDFTTVIEELEELRKEIKSAETTQELMGIEGNIRERYYRCWGEIVGQKYSLDKRVKRPPDNAINALISFCNGMVYSTTLSEIFHTQLLPTVSFLHGPGKRRYSLALDLSEIFKPLLADRMIFKLLNNKQIQDKHFRKELEFCYLEENGRKIILQEYDERLKTTIKHRNLNRKVSYRHLIRLEAYKLVNIIVAGEEYRAFKAWW